MSSATQIYNAFKYGARLKTEDVRRLLEARGHRLSGNRIREISRNSDRSGPGSPLSLSELYDLISQWADEQRADD